MAEGEEEDKDGKTEEPTEKKLRDAREKGDVPASRETGNLMSIFMLFVLVVFMLPRIAGSIAGSLSGIYSNAGQFQIGSGRAGLTDIGGIILDMARDLAPPVLPIFGMMILGAIFGVLVQGETVVSTERIKPKLSNISPLSGFKRLFSWNSVVEFLKSMAKVLVIGALALWIARNAVTGLWRGPGFLPEELPRYIAHYASLVLIAASAFMLPIALGDIIWKRFSWLKKHRMSHKDLRDERKDMEGDPHIKAKRHQIRHARARQRLAQAVPGASVILTNPTHYAVALRYEQGVDTAPVCVAKGADLIAKRIRDLAREHEVPIVENKPLARALHAKIEVDDMVPVEHWQAVAEIIGYVIDLRRNIRRKPPAGSALRVED
ncbi:EscU/YscU/HrcU family type III secretion system export apparatus switch protein [Acidimangrovimonas pyrenivorans]|uniref:Flagellar biosynthesis protein FlhB n=1 Tax=Acidimangrovimonas pyrenivorans TaxID=2030798 RepID=A0ABV7ANM2_9RHOB